MSVINKVRLAPANRSSGTATGSVGGRPYSCAVGSTIDVIESDANALQAQGFVFLGPVGATANRPAYPPNANSDPRFAALPVGTDFTDTTIGKCVVFNGQVWLDAVTGAVV